MNPELTAYVAELIEIYVDRIEAASENSPEFYERFKEREINKAAEDIVRTVQMWR